MDPVDPDSDPDPQHCEKPIKIWIAGPRWGGGEGGEKEGEKRGGRVGG